MKAACYYMFSYQICACEIEVIQSKMFCKWCALHSRLLMKHSQLSWWFHIWTSFLLYFFWATLTRWNYAEVSLPYFHFWPYCSPSPLKHSKDVVVDKGHAFVEVDHSYACYCKCRKMFARKKPIYLAHHLLSKVWKLVAFCLAALHRQYLFVASVRWVDWLEFDGLRMSQKAYFSFYIHQKLWLQSVSSENRSVLFVGADMIGMSYAILPPSSSVPCLSMSCPPSPPVSHPQCAFWSPAPLEPNNSTICSAKAGNVFNHL